MTDCNTACDVEQSAPDAPFFPADEPEPLSIADQFRAIGLLETLPILIVATDGVREQPK